MPGSFVFKPIEANLTHNTKWLGKMDPYCAFLINDERIKSQVCKNGGEHPQWVDSVTISAPTQTKIEVELMDKGTLISDDQIGTFSIDLQEIESQGKVSKWYPLIFKNDTAGEILMESIFNEESVSSEAIMTGEEALAFEKPIIEEGVKTFIEQRQTVESHTFTKEVDVVETRAVQQEIEVLEARKVIKEVQYTEAVPVTKSIETIEPQVVKKEIEVMEPRLITKTIQVVENVPVMKEVEIIENVTVMKEIQTFEPQTFTKEVEVIEQVPVMKTVTVTEPVTIKKAVEFVEPVIITQTITKEIRPDIIVDEKITKSFGPASVIGMESEVMMKEDVFMKGIKEVKEEKIIDEERFIDEERIIEKERFSDDRIDSDILDKEFQQKF